MWAFLLLCAIVGSAAAGPWSNAPGFNPGQKYKYQVISRSVASVNEVGNQYVGTAINATLEMALDKRNSSQLNVRVRNPQWATINGSLSQGWNSPLTGKIAPKWQPLPLQNSNFAVQFKNGKIRNITVNARTSRNETNLFRGMISPIILQNRQSLGVSSVMEESVLGEYQTQYEVSHIPAYLAQASPQWSLNFTLNSSSHFIQVSKATNFTKSKLHRIYHSGLAPKDQSDIGSSSAGAIVRSALSRLLLEGRLSNYTIYQVVSESQLESSSLPVTEQKSKVNSQVNLTLVAQSPGAVEPPSNPQNRSIQAQMIPNQNEERTYDPHSRQRRSYEANFKSAQFTGHHSIKAKNAPAFNNKNKQQSSSSSSSSESSSSDSSSDSSSGSSSGSSSSGSSSGSSSSSSSSEEDGPLQRPASLKAPSVNLLYPLFSWQDQKQIVENIVDVSKKIGKQLSGFDDILEQYTLQNFLVLVELARNATQVQLEMATLRLYPEGSSSQAKRYAWASFRDAVAQAGTGPALHEISSWRDDGKISSNEAAFLMASLPNSAILPSPVYLQYLQDKFVNNRTAQNQRPLFVEALMSLSQLTRQACVDSDFADAHYPVHTYKKAFKGCSQFADKLGKWLSSQLESAAKSSSLNRTHNVLLYINALGELGSNHTAKTFNLFLGGHLPAPLSSKTRLTIFQRTVMMASLLKLAEVNPELAQDIAYNVYQNEGEAYEVRAMAVYIIMHTNPSATMLQRMARASYTDSNPQVASAVISAIQSAAESEDPDRQQLTQNARAAVHLLQNQPMSIHYSHMHAQDFFMQEISELGYNVRMSFLGSEDSLFPKAHHIELERTLGGMQLPNSEYVFMVSSVKKALGWQDGRKAPRQPRQNPDGSINMGPAANETLEAFLRYPVLGADLFSSFSEYDIPSFQAVALEALQNLTANNQTYNFTKMVVPHELNFVAPDVTGAFNYVSLKTATLLQGSLSAKLNLYQNNTRINSQSRSQSNRYNQPRNKLSKLYAILNETNRAELLLTAHLRYIALQSSHTGQMNAFGQPSMNQFDAGVEQQAMINIPAKLNLTLNYTQPASYSRQSNRSSGFEISIQPLTSGNITISRLKTEPFTSYQAIRNVSPLAESQNKTIVSLRQPQTILNYYGPSNMFLVNVTSENEFVDYAAYARAVRHRDLLSSVLLPFPYAFPDLQNNDFSLQLNASQFKQFRLSANCSLSSAVDLRPLNGSSTAKSSQRGSSRQKSSVDSDAFTSIVNLAASIQGPSEKNIYRAYVSTTTSEMTMLNALHIVANSSQSSSRRGEQLLQELNAKVNGSWSSVPLFNMKKASQNNPNSSVSFELFYNNRTNSKPPMNIQGNCNFLRTHPRKKFLSQQSPLVAQCEKQLNQHQHYLPACLNATYQMSTLDATECHAKYDNVVPFLVNVSNCLFLKAQSYLSPYLFANPLHRGKPNTAFFKLQFTPSLSGVSINVSSPNYAAAFNNISLSPLQQEILPLNPAYPFLARKANAFFRWETHPICSVDESFIKTLDNNTYPLNNAFGHCWHTVIRQDPGPYAPSLGNQNISVLIRDVDHDNRAVRVILENGETNITMQQGVDGRFEVRVGSQVGFHIKGPHHEISIPPSNGSGMKTFVQTNNNVISVELNPDSNGPVSVRIQNPSVQLYFDNQRLLVLPSNSLRNQVHGLCGTFNGNPSTDFSDMADQVRANPEDFVASMVSDPKECRGPALQAYRHANRANASLPKDIIIFPLMNLRTSNSKSSSSSMFKLFSQGGNNDESDDSSSSSSSDSDSDSDSNSSSDSSSDSDTNESNNSNDSDNNGNSNKKSNSKNRKSHNNNKNNNNNNSDQDSNSSSSSSSNSDSNSSSDSSDSSSSSSSSSSDSNSNSNDDSSSNNNNKNSNKNNKKNNKNNKNNNSNSNDYDNNDSNNNNNDSNDSNSSNNSNNNNNDSNDTDNNDNSNSANDYGQNGRRHNPKGKALCSTKLTKLVILDDGDKFCFTKEALRKCNKPCRPSKLSSKSVEVHCIQRGRTAEYFQQQLQRGQNVDFSQKSTSQNLQLQVPESCH